MGHIILTCTDDLSPAVPLYAHSGNAIVAIFGVGECPVGVCVSVQIVVNWTIPFLPYGAAVVMNNGRDLHWSMQYVGHGLMDSLIV